MFIEESPKSKQVLRIIYELISSVYSRISQKQSDTEQISQELVCKKVVIYLYRSCDLIKP
jgi:hypothetical protein